MKFLKLLCSIILPPLGVGLSVGVKNIHFWINIVLTLLGYFPGLLHAIYVIFFHEESQS
jgi:uncharacterized membrane protein YqaE (UPF0057 family)